MKKVLFLYTEMAPYFIACVERLVADHDVEVHIVHWPVNQEAPFKFSTGGKVFLHPRASLDQAGLRRLADGLKPDIILCSGWVDKGYLQVCRAARRHGVPTVMVSDTAWQGRPRQWMALVLARFWLHRTFSQAWVTGKEQARYAEYLGFAREQIRKGFYAADLDRFAPLAERFREGKAKAYPHRFLCVARYIPSKGHQYMMEAFAELCDAGEAGDWELWCIGTGELFPPAFSHPRITHWGFVQADEVGPYMGQSGVFVLPSLYEPWGVVVHEHAAAGLPLLLSNAVGARQRFLRKGQNGTCFNAGSKEALKEGFRTMIATGDDKLLAMGMCSHKLAMEWGPRQWAATLMELMQPAHG
ncbi:MAG TPA: glycosyltransferase family 4 protein [Flavobacteriales bacterium]|nr:glycosyltransferase family 4 protein [Flavobacteriales bacterium]